MSIEFPLSFRLMPLGPVSDPTIPVIVATSAGLRTYRFVIDTGADFSLAPRRLAQQVDLDWDRLRVVQAIGVASGGLSVRLGHLPIQVSSVKLTIRCLYADLRQTPFILGRSDFLDRFVLTIDHRLQRIILTQIP
jgi:predicted aspartyl protease